MFDGVKSYFANRQKPTQEDLRDFFSDLSCYCESGIAVGQGIEFMYNDAKKPQMKSMIGNLLRELRNGRQLSVALKSTMVFPPFITQIVYVGEDTGELNTVLREILFYLDQSIEVDEELKSGLFSVKFFFCAVLSAIAMAVFIVIPKIDEILRELDVELPLLSAIIMNAAMFVVGHWFLFLLLGVCCFVGGRYYARVNPEKIDRWKLRVPIYSNLYQLELQYRLSKILSLVLRSSVAFVDGMQYAALSIDHIPTMNVLREAAKHMKNGYGAADALEKANREHFVDVRIVNMIRTGERTSSVYVLLSNTSEHYRKNFLRVIKTFATKVGTTVIIPLMIVLLVVMGAVYAPIITMMGAKVQ